jgi:hypothetical protein
MILIVALKRKKTLNIALKASWIGCSLEAGQKYFMKPKILKPSI